jgi:hypothetical protein
VQNKIEDEDALVVGLQYTAASWSERKGQDPRYFDVRRADRKDTDFWIFPSSLD